MSDNTLSTGRNQNRCCEMKHCSMQAPRHYRLAVGTLDWEAKRGNTPQPHGDEGRAPDLCPVLVEPMEPIGWRIGYRGQMRLHVAPGEMPLSETGIMVH